MTVSARGALSILQTNKLRFIRVPQRAFVDRSTISIEGPPSAMNEIGSQTQCELKRIKSRGRPHLISDIPHHDEIEQNGNFISPVFAISVVS